jgi:hypothetical protein
MIRPPYFLLPNSSTPIKIPIKADRNADDNSELA